MNKNQTLLPFKGFYYSFLAFVLLLSSCEMDWKEIGIAKIPEFAGTWVSESDQNKIYITMVHEKLYQVKGDGNIVSGSYSLSSDFTHLSLEKEVNVDMYGRKTKKVVYEIHYSKDGRLFSPDKNVFYKRAK
jgi:hypothetical protein